MPSSAACSARWRASRATGRHRDRWTRPSPRCTSRAPRAPGRCHGGPLGDAERAVYERVAAEPADLLAQRVGPCDIVLLHDPQTAGRVIQLVEKGVPVIWRAHIGLDVPNDRAREA